jgi:ferric-dicitrate binding protein FerR (iron transport regulator)
MITNHQSYRLVLCLVVAVLTVSATMAFTGPNLQAQRGPSGRLAVVGEVTVNGTNAISGATVFSDSTVTTAKGSSAVVSLGKLGRVEVLPESTMKLSFSDSSISVSMLDSGRVRVSSSMGTAAHATTNDGEIVATGSRQNEFTVDTSCGDTLVAVKKGSVELRAGDTVKQIAAGSQDSAGTTSPGCTRR